MCEFCNEKNLKIKKSEEIYIFNNKLYFDNSGEEYNHSFIDIYYCPMCR